MSSPMRAPGPRFAPRMAGIAIERARLHVVPRVPRLRTRAPRMPFVTLVSVVLLAGVVGLLLFNTSMQQASFTATQLETQATVLSARQQSLKMELDKLRDPQGLGMAAHKQGLVPAPPPSFLDLSSGRISGPLLPASAANDLRIGAPVQQLPAELNPPPVKVRADPPGDIPANVPSGTKSKPADLGAHPAHHGRGTDHGGHRR